MATATDTKPSSQAAGPGEGEKGEREGGQDPADVPLKTPDALTRSHIQRMDALARANHIRTQRAKVKRELRAGRVTIDQLLLDPPSCIDTAKVFDLLLAVPRYGRVKVNKILAHCRISPSKTIGGLSERQRAELVLLLRR